MSLPCREGAGLQVFRRKRALTWSAAPAACRRPPRQTQRTARQSCRWVQIVRSDADKFHVVRGTPFVITPYRYQIFNPAQSKVESREVGLKYVCGVPRERGLAGSLVLPLRGDKAHAVALVLEYAERLPSIFLTLSGGRRPRRRLLSLSTMFINRGKRVEVDFAHFRCLRPLPILLTVLGYEPKRT